MSAFLCSDGLINALVTYAEHEGVALPGAWDTQGAAQLLRTENERSLMARYGGRHGPQGRHTGIRYTRTRILSPMEAIKAAHCLAYQSCEHAGWDNSEASRFLDRVVWTASQSLDGYRDAPGWDDLSNL